MEALFLKEVKAMSAMTAGRKRKKPGGQRRRSSSMSIKAHNTVPKTTHNRTKSKGSHHSTLEILDGVDNDDDDNDDDASAATVASAKSKDRKRKFITPASTKINQRRTMSLAAKSKLDSLASPAKHTVNGYSSGNIKVVKGEGQGGEGAGWKVKQNSISTKNTKESTQMRRVCNTDQDISPKTNKKSGKKKQPQQQDNTKEVQSPEEISYSPLDYRPASRNNNSDTIASSNLLETYVNQWTKPSPELNSNSNDDNKRGKKKDQTNVNNINHHHQESIVDDPSSAEASSASVISNSDNDDDIMGDRDIQHSVVKNQTKSYSSQHEQQQLAVTSKASQHSNNSSDFMLNVPTTLKLNDKDLQLEYGKLVFMKKDLEHKMHNMGATFNNNMGTEQEKVKQPLFTVKRPGHCFTLDGDSDNNNHMHSSSLSPSTSLPPCKMNGDLEIEYGKLAFIKRDLEHKAAMQKIDADKVNPWATTANTSHNNMLLGEEDMMLVPASAAAHPSSIARRDEKFDFGIQSDNINGEVPLRQDVAFGEMAFQRTMAKQHRSMSNELDSDNEQKHGHSSQPKSNKKKKRKRRVVETITRVIHEELEEEDGSASTSGDKQGGGRYHPYSHSDLGWRRSSEPYHRGRDHTAEQQQQRRSGKKYEKYAYSNQPRKGMKVARSPTISASHKKATSPDKRRQKQSSGNKRGRHSANQPSMLESLV